MPGHEALRAGFFLLQPRTGGEREARAEGGVGEALKGLRRGRSRAGSAMPFWVLAPQQSPAPADPHLRGDEASPAESCKVRHNGIIINCMSGHPEVARA